MDLNDQVFIRQFDVLSFYGNSVAKEEYSKNLRELQVLIYDLLNRLSEFDPYKLKDKIHLVDDAVLKFDFNWNQFKVNAATTKGETAVTSTTSATSSVPTTSTTAPFVTVSYESTTKVVPLTTTSQSSQVSTSGIELRKRITLYISSLILLFQSSTRRQLSMGNFQQNHQLNSNKTG